MGTESSQPPRISVLIPTYNYAHYLPEAIESVLRQEFKDFELIIADDCSQDNTDEVCTRYATRDPRVLFHRHTRNLGMVRNWNWCLREARGTFIKYLFADDMLAEPTSLTRYLEALERHPNTALVTSARLTVDEQSRPLAVRNLLGARDRVFPGGKITDRCFGFERQTNPIGEPTSVMFRRTQADRGFGEHYRQLVDLEMWLHLLQRGDLVYIAEPLCCFRTHPAQQTEVNRADFRHQHEETEVCRRYCRTGLNRVLFRKMYKMRKSGNPAFLNTIADIRRTFSLPHYLWRTVEYRVMRVFFNLRRFFLKRFSPSPPDPTSIEFTADLRRHK